MDDDLDGVVSNIRACIISFKGPVPMRSLLRDYETLVGSSIPYRKLNYPSLESFLQSLSSLRVTGSGRDIMVEAAVTSSSSHMSSLIAKQKTAKKSFPMARRGGERYLRSYGQPRPYQPRSSYTREPTRQQYYTPSPQYNQPRPQYNAPKPQYVPPPRLQSKKDQPNTANTVQPLVVKVDSDDNRQVSVGDGFSSNKQPSTSSQKDYRYKTEVPPRFQKSQHNSSSHSPPVSEAVKEPEENAQLYRHSLELSDLNDSSNTIISALKPGQLVAAARAKHQAAQLQYENENYYLQDPFIDNNEIQNLALAADVLVPVPDQVDVLSNINLLDAYALARNWSAPEYTVFTRKPKGVSLPQYGASVKISGDGQSVKKFSCYPYEYDNIYIARGHAAKRALEEFCEEEKVKQYKDIVCSDKTVMCDRISALVAGIYNGMFAKTVEEQYTDKYEEPLPSDWLQTLNSCPTVSVESSINSIIILPRDPTLQPVLNKAEPSPAPQALETPPDDIWDVYVTYATTTSNVWCRLIGENYSEKYEELLTNMEYYYKTNGSEEQAVNIEVDQHYAAESQGGWFRICVSDVNEDSKMVTALLIDHGDSDIFPFSSLYRLPADFCTLPRQAIQCTLEGLENFDDSFTSEIISSCEDLVGKSLIAQVNVRDQETGLTKIILYDTSGKDDVNVNEKIKDDIIYAKAEPELPNEGCALEVYVSSVSKRGEVYVQVPGPTYNRIQEVLETLNPEEISKHKLTSFRQVVLHKMYLAKYSKDEKWYRAIVTATPSVQQNKIAVRFIDFGNDETVSISDMADLENLPPLLSNLPPQALAVALHNLPVETLTNTEIAKLHSLLLDEEKIVLIKTVKLQEDPPIVEIFCKNHDENSALVSVNNTVYMQRILFKPDEKKSSANNTLNPNQATNGHGLQRPKLDDSFLPVHIVLAANPGNFIFQPLKYAKEFESMMAQLQAYYNATTLLEVSKEEIVKGALFAVRYEDDIWYRAVVTGAVIGSKVPVRLCDYGDVVAVPVSNLRDLAADFRTIPFIAVKGKLAGVKPIHTDWAVDDCMRFQNLAMDKVLASVVMNIDDSFGDPMDMVASLRLTDTTTDKDKVISHILVSENRAVAIKEKS